MIEYNKEIRLKQHKRLGYLYFSDVKHPLADPQGFVWYHRHAASLKAGRWVKSTEEVHHIDGNVNNNIDRNLKIISSKSKHSVISGSIKKNMYNKTFKMAAGISI